MARREKARAKTRRAELKAELGNKCAWCETTTNLEFDCIIPQGDKHHRLDTSRRMTFYYRQHAVGNVQLLCRQDNNIKAILDAEHLKRVAEAREEARVRPKPADEVPF